jgi:hypothetical protein
VFGTSWSFFFSSSRHGINLHKIWLQRQAGKLVSKQGITLLFEPWNDLSRHESLLQQSTTTICSHQYPSKLICLCPSCGILLLVGSERACKTIFHAPDIRAFISFLLLSQHILKIATAGSSSDTQSCTHHGTPVLAMHSIPR